MPVGQDEKAAVVDDQLEAVILDGASPNRSSDPVQRTSRPRRKSSEGLPIDRARRQRTRGFRRSWAMNPGNDAAASVSGNAALRMDERAGQKSPTGSTQLPSDEV